MDSENEQSYHQVKTRRFFLDKNTNVKSKKPFFNSRFVSCFRHFVSEALPTLPNIVEETGELLKAEDAQSNALELFFGFRQLYLWPKRTG